jgi:hypothetical protein
MSYYEGGPRASNESPEVRVPEPRKTQEEGSGSTLGMAAALVGLGILGYAMSRKAPETQPEPEPVQPRPSAYQQGHVHSGMYLGGPPQAEMHAPIPPPPVQNTLPTQGPSGKVEAAPATVLPPDMPRDYGPPIGKLGTTPLRLV